MFRTKGFLINFILGALFLFTFTCFVLRIRGAYTPKTYKPNELVSPYHDEDFDPALMRLNTMSKLEAYCDSIYDANKDTRSYPGVVSEVIRLKFFHGYSAYDASTNAVSMLTAPLIRRGYNAIVIPEDLVKYPNAACSQQSIVGMELFKNKGYKVRKVTMWDTVSESGHFAYEVFYDGGWHFFDTNQEPDAEVLKKYNRPSVAFLAAHPEVVAEAYRKRDYHLFQRLIASYKTGPVDEFPAHYAYAFQSATKFLTYFGWAFVWLFIVIRNRRLAGKPILSFGWLRIRRQSNPAEQAMPQLNQPEVAA